MKEEFNLPDDVYNLDHMLAVVIQEMEDKNAPESKIEFEYLNCEIKMTIKRKAKKSKTNKK